MNDSYLMHYGVKGMKWGIRRYQNEDGSLTADGKKRYLEKTDDIMFNTSADRGDKLKERGVTYQELEKKRNKARVKSAVLTTVSLGLLLSGNASLKATLTQNGTQKIVNLPFSKVASGAALIPGLKGSYYSMQMRDIRNSDIRNELSKQQNAV